MGTTSPLLLGVGDVILSAEDFSALGDVISVELEQNIIYDIYIYIERIGRLCTISLPLVCGTTGSTSCDAQPW